MGLRPAFRIVANGDDITAQINARLERLTLVDKAGIKSDTLDLVLADNDPLNPIVLPETGAELQVWIGYDVSAQEYGLFIVDEVGLSGPASRVSIRAHASPQTLSREGRESLQTQKTRSWPEGTTLGAMAEKIASEHGLTPKVFSELAAIALPHTDQVNESDINLLTRLARNYDALVKPAGGNLAIVKRGQSTSATGAPLPVITLTPGELTSWDMRIAKRATAGSVVATWRDAGTAEDKEVTAGESAPIYRLRNTYANESEASAAAQSELDRRKRAGQTVSVRMPGRSDLMAEGRVKFEGFRRDMNVEWVVTDITHEITKSAGYTCRWSGEIPQR